MKTFYKVFENKIYFNIDDEVRNDPFTTVKNRNYYQFYIKIRKHLKKSGFSIEKNPFYTGYFRRLAKDHLIARKNNVCILINLEANCIEFVFSDKINIWDSYQSAWTNSSDDRFKPLSYLRNAAVKIQIYKLGKLLESFGAIRNINNSTDLTPEDYIIKKLQHNTHIHGMVNCLDDIAKSIDSGTGKYNQGSNSDDKYKRKIKCGETKYFYNYHGVLSCGVVWHNINNMWWVICGKKLYNVASFGLFDYTPGLPRRNKIEAAIRHEQRFANERQYLKALSVEVSINKKLACLPEGGAK